MQSKRKLWTQEEDQILKMLRQERNQKKWSVIARKMQQQFNISGKTGKKCRERYMNYLNPERENLHWNHQQDHLLIKYHQQYGNKWSIIAQNLNRKTQNCVKNRFYSKFRKILRKLNHFISKNPNIRISPISLEVVYKIISMSESRFKVESKICEQWIQLCTNLVSQMYHLEANYRKKQAIIQDQSFYCDIITKITEFQLNLKKRKNRNNQQNQKDYKGRIFGKFQTKKRQVKVRMTSKLKNQQININLQNFDNEDIKNDESFQMISQAEHDSNQLKSIYSWFRGDPNPFEVHESLEIYKNNSYFQMLSFSQEYPNLYSNL